MLEISYKSSVLSERDNNINPQSPRSLTPWLISNELLIKAQCISALSKQSGNIMIIPPLVTIPFHNIPQNKVLIIGIE